MLTARQRLLSAVLHLTGRANLLKFEDRLLLQKRIFLLAMTGVDLGYTFSWYLRGPYSPGLTRDAFTIDEAQKKGMNAAEMPTPHLIQTRLLDLKDALGSKWNDPVHLELLASVLFLAKSSDADENIIGQRLSALKPKRFSQAQVHQALAWLTNQRLVP